MPPPKMTPYPTLLTKPDAMLWAAETLDRLRADIGLLVILSGAMLKNGDKATGEAADAVAEMRAMMSGILDADLQLAAMKAAAAEIRAAAKELQLLDARAAARGTKV